MQEQPPNEMRSKPLENIEFGCSSVASIHGIKKMSVVIVASVDVLPCVSHSLQNGMANQFQCDAALYETGFSRITPKSGLCLCMVVYVYVCIHGVHGRFDLDK